MKLLHSYLLRLRGPCSTLCSVYVVCTALQLIFTGQTVSFAWREWVTNFGTLVLVSFALCETPFTEHENRALLPLPYVEANCDTPLGDRNDDLYTFLADL